MVATQTPTCPECGHAMTDDEMIAHKDDDLFAIAPSEREADIECPACDSLYIVQGGYIPHYTSRVDPDESC